MYIDTEEEIEKFSRKEFKLVDQKSFVFLPLSA